MTTRLISEASCICGILAAASLCPSSACAETLVVAKDTVKLVEEPNAADDIPDAMEIHGELRLRFATSGEYKFYVPGKSTGVTATLGGDAGDQGLITIATNVQLTTYQSNGIRGSFVLRSPTAGIRLVEGGSLRASAISADQEVSFPEEAFEAVEIGTNCFVQSGCCYHKVSKPMRIRFKGPGAKWLGWSYGSAFFETGSGGVELIGQSDSPVWMESANGGSVQYVLAGWSKDVTFKGDCDVRLVSTAASRPICLNKAASGKGVPCFQQTGDLIFSGSSSGGCETRVEVPNVFGYGPATGNVVVESNVGKTAHTLDLKGCSQKLNGLDLQNGSVVTSSTDPVTLTFGTDNADGVLNGTINDPNITLVKVGTGTLTVTRETTLRQLDLQAGTLLVDGATLTCPALTQAAAAKIVCLNGGKVVAPGITAKWCVADGLGAVDASYPAGQCVNLEHDTPGTGTLLSGGTFADVNVSAGTLRIGGDLVADKYWCFLFREANSAFISTNKDSSLPQRWVALAVNRIHLFSTVGDVTNLKLVTATAGTAAADLAEGKVTTSAPNCTSDGISGGQGGHYRGVNYLTYGLMDNWYNGVAWDAPAVAPDDETTWISVTMRLKDSAAAATGYNLVRAVNSGVCGIPMQWTVSSSADGVNWTERDVRSVPKGEITGSQSYSNDGVNYLFREGKESWAFAPSGTVTVVAGATLDLGEVPAENIAIRRIEVDLAVGAGSITKFVPAANGEIRLVNVTGELGRWTELHDVGSVVDEGNLKSWTVSVNGVVNRDYEVRVRNGKLCVHRLKGFVLIFK